MAWSYSIRHVASGWTESSGGLYKAPRSGTLKFGCVTGGWSQFSNGSLIRLHSAALQLAGRSSLAECTERRDPALCSSAALQAAGRGSRADAASCQPAFGPAKGSADRPRIAFGTAAIDPGSWVQVQPRIADRSCAVFPAVILFIRIYRGALHFALRVSRCISWPSSLDRPAPPETIPELNTCLGTISCHLLSILDVNYFPQIGCVTIACTLLRALSCR